MLAPPISTQPPTAYEATYRTRPSILSSTGTDRESFSLFAVPTSLPEGYALQSPLLVRVEWDEGEFIAASDAVRAFGVGSAQAEAVSDFAESLVERYEALTGDEGSLVNALQRELDDLRKIVAAP